MRAYHNLTTLWGLEKVQAAPSDKNCGPQLSNSWVCLWALGKQKRGEQPALLPLLARLPQHPQCVISNVHQAPPWAPLIQLTNPTEGDWISFLTMIGCTYACTDYMVGKDGWLTEEDRNACIYVTHILFLLPSCRYTRPTLNLGAKCSWGPWESNIGCKTHLIGVWVHS